MKSPCLTCDLGDKSKDNPVCKDCELRIQYVNSIDGMELPDQDMRIRKRASSEKLKKGELFIQSICDQFHVEPSDIKSRKFGGNLREIRRQIANTLRYQYKLSMKDIGKLLNKTQQSVSKILNPEEVKPTSKKETFTFNIPPASSETVNVGHHDTYNPEDRKVIFIDFKKVTRLDLWGKLIKAADVNFRTVEGHALYLINKGLNDEQH